MSRWRGPFQPGSGRIGTKGLVKIHAVVGPVQLVEIDVVGAKASEAGFDCPVDPEGGRTLPVGVRRLRGAQSHA